MEKGDVLAKVLDGEEVKEIRAREACTVKEVLLN